jgi:hypothetical protein
VCKNIITTKNKTKIPVKDGTETGLAISFTSRQHESVSCVPGERAWASRNLGKKVYHSIHNRPAM